MEATQRRGHRSWPLKLAVCLLGSRSLILSWSCGDAWDMLQGHSWCSAWGLRSMGGPVTLLCPGQPPPTEPAGTSELDPWTFLPSSPSGGHHVTRWATSSRPGAD